MTKQNNWRQHLDKGIRIMSEVADIAVHVNRVGPIGLAAVGARAFNTFNELSKREPFSFFDGWHYLKVGGLCKALFSLCESRNLLCESTTSRGAVIKAITANIHGHLLGWRKEGSHLFGPYCAPEHTVEQAEHALRVFVWESLGPTLKYTEGPRADPVLTPDTLTSVLPSQTAREIWSCHEPFVVAEKHRAFLVYGEPGTGKSHLVRYIGNLAGGLRLRVKARDLALCEDLGDLVKFLQPSAFIVDDIDRVRDPEAILDALDEIKENTPLFMATVNYLQRLDPATLRRFHDWHHLEKLDDGVLNRMLEGVDPEIAKRLRKLPVNYIDQYRETQDSRGPEAAVRELEKLISRRDQVVEAMKKATNKG